jgi:hypothetical protein
MITKRVFMHGRHQVLACDGKCDKAWGINGRPRLFYMEEEQPPRALKEGERPRDDDDMVFVRDSDLGTAPGPGKTRGLSEGSDLKPSAVPLADGQAMNKWCARECEPGDRFKEGEPIVLKDLENPRPNMRHRT